MIQSYDAHFPFLLIYIKNEANEGIGESYCIQLCGTLFSLWIFLWNLVIQKNTEVHEVGDLQENRFNILSQNILFEEIVEGGEQLFKSVGNLIGFKNL